MRQSFLDAIDSFKNINKTIKTAEDLPRVHDNVRMRLTHYFDEKPIFNPHEN